MFILYKDNKFKQVRLNLKTSEINCPNYDNEKYYSVFSFNNSYYKCEGLDIKTINPQGIFKDSKGELIMAFYASLNY